MESLIERYGLPEILTHLSNNKIFVHLKTLHGRITEVVVSYDNSDNSHAPYISSSSFLTACLQSS